LEHHVVTAERFIALEELAQPGRTEGVQTKLIFCVGKHGARRYQVVAVAGGSSSLSDLKIFLR
jgi:hypothetical protein